MEQPPASHLPGCDGSLAAQAQRRLDVLKTQRTRPHQSGGQSQEGRRYMLRAGANHRRAGGICSERLNGRGREHGNIRVPTGFGSKRAICVVPHAGVC
eukprot:1950185-Pyramimonas_sp.AAC.2